MSKKYILDVCCGPRMFWFKKEHKNTIYGDIRKKSVKIIDGRRIEINPNLVMDFRDLPFKDSSFRMVIFDPPHLKSLGKNSYIAQKYGMLFSSWETDIKKGFDECYRVLEDFGTMVFKWNEYQIPVNKIISIIKIAPLIGNRSGKQLKTHWMVFIKGIE